jgi:hypothetical protein
VYYLSIRRISWKLNVECGCYRGRVVERGAIQREQLPLPADADGRRAQLNHRPVSLTGIGQLVFQPLQCHLEPTDLLLEFPLPFLVLALAVNAIAAENRAPYLQQLALPLADLVEMHAVLAGQFVERFEPLRGVQSQLKLELGIVAGAFLGHRADPPQAWLSSAEL